MHQRYSGSRAIFGGPLVPVVITNRYQCTFGTGLCYQPVPKVEKLHSRGRDLAILGQIQRPRNRRTDARLRAPDRRRAPSGCRRRDSPPPCAATSVRRRPPPAAAPPPPRTAGRRLPERPPRSTPAKKTPPPSSRLDISPSLPSSPRRRPPLARLPGRPTFPYWSSAPTSREAASHEKLYCTIDRS